jgi:hypothetical protein
VIWLNGPFGVGKSTVARILLNELPSARPFDPEHVGFLLRRSLPLPTGDFQDLPAWRHLTVETARLIADPDPPSGEQTRQADLVVPMALVHPTYRSEIHSGLHAAGLQLHEFSLVAERATIVSRIERDVLVPDDPGQDARARSWRLEHLDDTLETCRRLPAPAAVIDTTHQSPEQVATHILQALGAP